MKTRQELDKALEAIVPGFAIEGVGERQELVIYTGLAEDDDGNLVEMSDD